MSSRRIIAAVALAAVAVTLAACAGDEHSVPAERWDTSLPMTWGSSDELLSATSIVDGVALAYVATEGDGEALVARDASTGTELWSAASVPGVQPPGVAHSVATQQFDDRWTTAFLSPSSGQSTYVWGVMNVVDLHTGESVAPRVGDVWVRSTRPTACDDTYCLSGRRENDDVDQLIAYDPADGGSLVVRQAEGAPYLDGGRFLGTYVSSSDETGTEMLRYGVDGAISWSRPYAEVFGAGTSSTGGWAWLDEDLQLPAIGLGWVSVDFDRSRAGVVERDLTGSRMVALDRESGETLWALDGASTCNPTDDNLLRTDTTLVVCRFNRGAMSSHWDGTAVTDVTFADVDVDLVGIDAVSGEIRWELPLGDDPANVRRMGDGALSFAVGTIPVAVIDGSAVLVDPDTGVTQRTRPDAAMLCATMPEVVELRGAWSGGEPARYPGAPRYTLCSPSGAELEDAEISAGALQTAGLDPSGVTVLNMSFGVVAVTPRS